MMAIKKHKHLLIFIALTFFLYIVPLTLFPQCLAHDLAAHLNRIHCISDNLRQGKLFFPISQSLLNNYGYAFPLFYGDLFLYPLAFLVILGVSDKLVVSISMYGCAFFTLMSAYYAGARIFKDKTAAFGFSILYSFSSYLSVNYYTRYALGEMLAAIFLPLVVLGFWSIFYDDKKHWVWLPLGLSGIMYSHNLSTVITVLLLFVAAIISIGKIYKGTQIIKILFVSVLVFFCLTAAFVFPMIEQLMSTKFLSTTNQSSTYFGTLVETSMPTSWVFNDFILYKDLTNSYFNWIPNGIGLFPIITIVFALFVFKTKNRIFYAIYLVGLFFLFATTRRFPWEALQNVFGIIQFPWRLMLYATIFMAISSSILIKEKNNKIFILLVCLASLFSFVMASYRKYERNYKVYMSGFDYKYEYSNQIGTGEYLPAYKNENGVYEDCDQIQSYLKERGEIITSNNLNSQQMDFTRRNGEITVNYEGNEKDGTYIEVPLLLYKGYKAYDTNNGTELKITYGDHNVVRVYLNNPSGAFVVRYQRTPVQIISLSISTVTFAVLVIMYFVKNKNSK